MTKKEKYEKIEEMKTNLPIDDICEGLPEEFPRYFEYCRSLGYDEKPDYTYLRKLFKGLLSKLDLEVDENFDWVIQKKQIFPGSEKPMKKTTSLLKKFEEEGQEKKEKNRKISDFDDKGSSTS
jgi:hypothetical protein